MVMPAVASVFYTFKRRELCACAQMADIIYSKRNYRKKNKASEHLSFLANWWALGVHGSGLVSKLQQPQKHAKLQLNYRSIGPH